MTLPVVIVAGCVVVLWGFNRAGELRWAQVIAAAVGGYVAAKSGLGPQLGHVLDGVNLWAGRWLQ